MIDLERIQKLNAELTLYDRFLFSRVMNGNNVLAQKMINIYLHRDDLTVISVTCEETLINAVLGGKDARADALVMDREGNIFVIEIQNRVQDFPPQRSRGYSALMDLEQAKRGGDWKDMKPSYLIIQCAKDPFKRGEPMYVFERKDQKGYPLNDGSYIIYINGEYDDTSTALGKLCHDLKCKDIEDMMYNEIRESVRMYKEKMKGEPSMLGRVMEEFAEECRNEGRNEGQIKGAINALHTAGINGNQLVDTVAKSCNTTREVVQDYLAQMK